MPRVKVLRVLLSIAITVAFAVRGDAQPNGSGELDIARCWALQVDAPVSRVSADGVRVYAASDGAKFTALTRDGKRIWSAELGGEVVSNVLAGENSIYLVTNASGDNGSSVLRVLSRDTGIVSGTIALPTASRHFISAINGSLIIVSANGVVQMVDDKGGVKWRREIAGAFSGVPAIGSDGVHVASTSQQVFTIKLATGEIESLRKVPYTVTAVGATPSGVLIVGDDRGNLTSLSAEGRVNWRFRSGGRISRIFASNGHILALSHDNFVYRIDSSNGGVTWKRRLGGRAAHSATINGTYTLTTSLDEHGAVLTGLENGRPAGQIVLGGDEFVSADPVTVGELIIVGTNAAVYAYSLTGQAGCPK